MAHAVGDFLHRLLCLACLLHHGQCSWGYKHGTLEDNTCVSRSPDRALLCDIDDLAAVATNSWRPCLLYALFPSAGSNTKVPHPVGILEHHHLVLKPFCGLSRR